MRNNTIDTIKVISCFFIVMVHVGNYNEYPEHIGEIIRFMTRWALPFFFLSSGYLFSLGRGDLEARISTLVKILLVSSVIFSLVLVVKSMFIDHDGLYTSLREIFSFNLLYGVYFHLWFIPSMIIGFILLPILNSINKNKAAVISLFIIIVSWLSDFFGSLGFETNSAFFREIISIPLIFIGFNFLNNSVINRINRKGCALLFLFSLLMMFIEIVISQKILHVNSMERQLPLFCVASAIFLLLFAIKTNIKPSAMSKIGKEDSLSVYLYHPVYLAIFGLMFNKMGVDNSSLKLIVTFTATVISISLLRIYSNRVYRIINGNI